MIKKSLLFSVIVLLFIGVIPTGTANAHVLETDGGIGAVLHITPDDNPISDQSTGYVLSFQDISGRFRLSDCHCQVAFIKDGKTVTTQPLVAQSDQVSKNAYTFPIPGVYTVQVSGSPKHDGDFQAFTMDYIVRVSSDIQMHQDFPPLLWVGIGLTMGLVLLATVPAMYADNKKYKKE